MCTLFALDVGARGGDDERAREALRSNKQVGCSDAGGGGGGAGLARGQPREGGGFEAFSACEAGAVA